jgi:hypothetical protein
LGGWIQIVTNAVCRANTTPMTTITARRPSEGMGVA